MNIPDPVLKPSKPRANPKQILKFDNRMDRMELLTLLNHLKPAARLEYHAWVCKQAVIPGTYGLHPQISPETKRLALIARHCDRAHEKLTMSIITDISHMAIDYAVNLDACVDELVRRVRGKS